MTNRSARFWNRMAKGYAKRPVADQASYERKLEATRQLLRPDMNCLEYGCGTGSTALVHAPHVGHIRAIDISSKMIEIARGKADAAGIGNVSFEVDTIETLTAPDQSYDMVLALSILHLLEDKEAAIAKSYQLLKPGGYFVTSTVCLGETMAFFKYIGPIGRFFGLLPLISVFTPDHLVDCLTDAGFEMIERWQPAKGKALFAIARKPGID